ncbi:MAG: LysR family substrate-binding domain-containing protein [Actinomycetota bacterium]|nr:LysR family substrate-binding domain-containing protein [Actinomycetota bacterium]
MGFTVAYVPGVTVSKWARIWAERVRDVPLELLSITEPEQTAVLHDGRAQMCFVRGPVERAGMHVIALYTEVAVIVVPKEHAVALFDQVALADLGDERRVSSEDIPSSLALVAAGLGIVVVPQSIARLHSRRDLVYRPVTDCPPTQIGLAWLADNDEKHIEEFVGIVRGRTANSSRSSRPAEASPSQPSAAPRGRTRSKNRRKGR